MPVPLPPPPTRSLAEILPAEPLLLMGAGPVPIPHAVAAANGVVIDHLGETMDRVIQGVKAMARYAFQTEAEHVMGVAGPSSAALEMGLANICWPGRRVLSLACGTFGRRLAEMAEGVGAAVTLVEADSAHPVTAEMAREALAAGTFDVVTLVQGETSCGVLNAELPEIARIAHEHGALVVVDAVCTLTTMPMKMDAWQIDVAVTGGQKGLSSIPGVSLVAFSPRAWSAVQARPRPKPHWVLDAERAERFWRHQQYHYTAPVPGILAMHEALRLICEETLEARFVRHHQSSEALQAGIQTMGLDFLVPKAWRLPSVVAIRVPEGVSAHDVRREMAASFGVQISGAFGLDIIRVGQMGEQCRPRHLFRVIYAMGESFRRAGHRLDVSSGMAALERALERD